MLMSTLYLPRSSMEHGRTAVCPATTVTFTMGTSKAGSKPETSNKQLPIYSHKTQRKKVLTG